MSNQPEEGQNQNFTPPPQETPPSPPSYNQPAFYQQPEYVHPQQPKYYDPLLNTPGQTPYNYQQSRYRDAFPSFPPSNPLPLGEAMRQLPAQYWRVITRPRAATFDAEQGKAAWNIIWLQIIVLVIFRITLLALRTLESSPLSRPLGNSTLDFVVKNTSGFSTGSIIFSLISFPVIFFINTGIYFLIAKAFHGQGTFLRYIYCTLLITTPFNLVFGLLGLLRIPNLLTLINLVVLVYQIVLLVFMTMAVHRLSGGRATLAVIILPLIVFVLAIIAAIILVVSIINSHPY